MRTWAAIAFLYCVSIECQAQQLVQRLDPALYSIFQQGHVLPDGTHRNYFTTHESRHQHYSLPYFLDWNPAANVLEQWAPIDVATGFPYLYYSAELLVLPLPNGDCVLVSNNFDCDFSGRPTILYIDADRDIRWSKLDQDPDFYWQGVSKIGMVNRDTFVFLTHERPRFATSQGEEIDLPASVPYYVDLVFLDDRMIGYWEQQLVLMNDQFEVLHSRFIENIRFASAVGSSAVVHADSTVWLFDDQLHVQGRYDLSSAINSAQVLGDSIAIVTNDGILFFNHSLQLLDSLEALPAESIKYAVNDGDSIKVLSIYNGIQHKDVCVRSYPKGQDLPAPTVDVSLEAVVISDTVLVEMPLDVYYLIQLVFDTIRFQLQHEGSDTLYNCRIELDWYTGGLCANYQESWYIDSIAVPPGESKIIVLTDFKTDTVLYETRPPFCFWVESPNGMPDPDPSDNMACYHPPLVLGTNDPTINQIEISPNPASYDCRIGSGTSTGEEWQVLIYSLQGHLEKSIDNVSEHDSILVDDLPEGIHIVHVKDDNGLRGVAKLIIQR